MESADPWRLSFSPSSLYLRLGLSECVEPYEILVLIVRCENQRLTVLLEKITMTEHHILIRRSQEPTFRGTQWN